MRGGSIAATRGGGGARSVWDALDPTTAATSQVELVATFEATPAAASLAFAAPAGWEPSVGAVVRLVPRVDEKKGCGQASSRQ